MKEEKTEETLRSFFERNTNLFTVLGIFNALGIYSSQIKSLEYSEMLAFLFTMLSLAVLWPIIIDSPNDDYDDHNGYRGIRIKFFLLRFGLIMTQFGFVMNTMNNFPGMISVFILLSCLFTILPLMANFVVKKIDPGLKKSKIKVVGVLGIIGTRILIAVFSIGIACVIGHYSYKFFLFYIENSQSLPKKIKY